MLSRYYKETPDLDYLLISLKHIYIHNFFYYIVHKDSIYQCFFGVVILMHLSIFYGSI